MYAAIYAIADGVASGDSKGMHTSDEFFCHD